MQIGLILPPLDIKLDSIDFNLVFGAWAKENKIKKLAVFPFNAVALKILGTHLGSIQVEYFDKDSTNKQIRDIREIASGNYDAVFDCSDGVDTGGETFFFGHNVHHFTLKELRFFYYENFSDIVSQVKRGIQNVKEHFSEMETLTVAASEAYWMTHKTLLEIIGVVPDVYYRKTFADSHDVLVFMRGGSGYIHSLSFGFRGELYCIEDQVTAGRVKSLDGEGRAKDIDTSIYPHQETHVFNRLASKKVGDEFIFFPYGHITRTLGWGPINEFGHRIKGGYKDLCNRPSNEKVIAVFGGSAAWSYRCLYDEMFSALLEIKLNRFCEDNDKDIRFTVLNFGLAGHVVLNEMQSYLLFCNNLNPDYVIGHDGYNDFIHGLVTDPHLLNQHDITYHYQLERWPKILYQSAIPEVSPLLEAEVKNLLPNVIKAYISRKRQFQTVVESFGGKFIWGMQPFVMSKMSLSFEEKRYLEKRGRQAQRVTTDVTSLYENFETMVDIPETIDLVNLHQFFKRYDGDEHLFVDTVHTTPLGDSKIASLYTRFFIDRYLQ